MILLSNVEVETVMEIVQNVIKNGKEKENAGLRQ